MTNPCKVLVVENPKDRRNSMVAALKRLGQNITVSPSAEDAILHFYRSAFDVIVTDKVLPGKDGIGFIQMVRQLDERVGVVLVTTEGVEVPDEQVEGLSVWAILKKPISDEVLLDKVEGACQLAHLSPEKEEEFCATMQKSATKFRHIRADLRNESTILPPMEMQEELERYNRSKGKTA